LSDCFVPDLKNVHWLVGLFLPQSQ